MVWLTGSLYSICGHNIIIHYFYNLYVLHYHYDLDYVQLVSFYLAFFHEIFFPKKNTFLVTKFSSRSHLGPGQDSEHAVVGKGEPRVLDAGVHHH